MFRILLPFRFFAPLLLVGVGLPAAAQDVFSNGVIIDDNDNANAALHVQDDAVINDQACIGFSCVRAEVFDNLSTLRLNWSRPGIEFRDSSAQGTFPTHDWRIEINDNITLPAGQNFFRLRNVTENTIPFTIVGNAPSNALYLTSDGELGLGTSLPQANLHIIDAGGDAGIRFDDASFSPYNWYLSGNSSGFYVYDVTANRLPFEVRAGAPQGAFYIAENGQTGIGTRSPEELLHIRTTAADTDAFALFDAAGSGSDAAFLLRQNGTIPTTWEFRNQESSGRLNVGLAGGNTPFKIDNAANNNLLKLGLNGQPDAVVVTGRLLVNNTQIAVPDYVFEEGYQLKPLSEVSAYIETHGHLPGVPSAEEVAAQGLDTVAMQMALLEKVEELTLYTLDQQAIIAKLAAENAALTERLARIEALLAHD